MEIDIEEDGILDNQDWNLTELLPNYYLNPVHNVSDKPEKNGRDRDGNIVEGLPEDFVHLHYSLGLDIPGLNGDGILDFLADGDGIPGLLAGGIGYGGTGELPEIEGIQEAQPANLIPDDRRLEGTVKIVEGEDNTYILEPNFKIMVF